MAGHQAFVVAGKAGLLGASCANRAARSRPSGGAPARRPARLPAARRAHIRSAPAPLRAKLFDAERQAELVYFDAMGVAETTRLLFAAAGMPFKVRPPYCPRLLVRRDDAACCCFLLFILQRSSTSSD